MTGKRGRLRLGSVWRSKKWARYNTTTNDDDRNTSLGEEETPFTCSTGDECLARLWLLIAIFGAIEEWMMFLLKALVMSFLLFSQALRFCQISTLEWLPLYNFYSIWWLSNRAIKRLSPIVFDLKINSLFSGSKTQATQFWKRVFWLQTRRV